MPPAGFESAIPAVADPSLRPRGQWDRLQLHCKDESIIVVKKKLLIAKMTQKQGIHSVVKIKIF
jgi:hypothetical protein